VIKIKGWL